MSSPIILRGSCACNATSWTSTATPSHLDFCYCSQCQRVSGAPFVSWMGINRCSIVWSGNVQTFRLTISNGMNSVATRSCCSTCGGTMSMQYDCYPEKTHVAAGSVVEDVHGVMKSFKAGDHIFVADKPAWYTIPEDGVKRYDGFDQCFLDRQKRYEEGQKREQSKVSSEAPYDNEYREEEYKVLADFTMARDDDKTFEESDSEIEALRRQYGGTQRLTVGTTLDEMDSD